VKKSFKRAALALSLLSLSVSAIAAVSIHTDIVVQAEVATAVHVYYGGKDVTNGSINLSLAENAGYLTATTGPLLFIGNASSVSLSMTQPAKKQLISGGGDVMGVNAMWINPNGGSATFVEYNLSSIPVYPTLADVPDPNKGVQVQFKSTGRTETYPLGVYSGTYTILVTPST